MALIERSSNPAFSQKIYADQGYVGQSDAMTVQGTVNKSFMLFGILMVGAFYSWSLFDPAAPATPSVTWIGAIGGFVAALVTIFRPKVSGISAPIYAGLEGLFLGGISVMLEMRYPGIAMQAVMLTMGTMFSMLFMYKTGMIKVTEKLRSGIMAATGAIFLVYLISWIMSFFGSSVPMIHQGGMMGIGFSLLVIGIAAMNLLLDFDFIEKSARSGAPKYMEWFGAFGLMVTLIWLYLEFLRLLSKLRD
ncbi:MAG: Bax inhibitor-1/YccA family protein [Salibacteraceae bacterium]